LTPASETFAHDEAGRCQAVTTGGPGDEQRDYDATGRLWHRYVSGAQHYELGTYDSTVTYEYDDHERLVSALNVARSGPIVEELSLEYEEDGTLLEGLERYRRALDSALVGRLRRDRGTLAA
jgi:hypothetical protein